MDVRSLIGRTALVTGAGSGIGRASALAFAARGANLVICDIDAQGLEATAAALRAQGREVFARRVDVAVAAEMQAFADAVHERVPAVDLLMNNAGVAIGGGFLDTSLDDWSWILGVNLQGVIHGCRCFVPAMVARRAGGQVVNVASVAGYFSTQALAAYCTTKFAVLGLSEALREELHEHGIGVTCLCPGIIDTPITQNAVMRGRAAEDPHARSRMIEAYRRRAYGPERVAEGMLRAVQRNRGVAPITPEAWVLYYAKRLAPGLLGWLARSLARRSRRQLGLD